MCGIYTADSSGRTGGGTSGSRGMTVGGSTYMVTGSAATAVAVARVLIATCNRVQSRVHSHPNSFRSTASCSSSSRSSESYDVVDYGIDRLLVIHRMVEGEHPGTSITTVCTITGTARAVEAVRTIFNLCMLTTIFIVI